ncbi:hypothetical protein DOQ08_02982 [Marinobacter litoralis]|uniref:Uncharacterized protein n=1 Tax=Marinobacter litoralis TaxID=187981 RepID=A0A3M2R8U9_9GAMM|nr:hypothetical protein [Marinobacter litoralis]RMJ01708.1 hypothetical protein DOQ08_02982 [Marinobacter litoralis]
MTIFRCVLIASLCIVRRLPILALAFLFAHSAVAEMKGLSDGEMADIDGAGIGLVLENFLFSHGTDQPDGAGEQARIFRITGIKSTDGRDVDITVNHLYIAGANSNSGQNLTPVNSGRLTNPWRLDVVDGDEIGVPDVAVLEFAAPTKVPVSEGYDCLSSSAVAGSGSCSSRPATADWQGERADIGLQMNVAVGDDRSANLNIHASSAVIDASYIRIWGDSDRRQMAGQFRFNLYSPEITINACSHDGSTCGSKISMSDFVLELAMGNNQQPVFFDVDATGNFLLEIDTMAAPANGTIAANGLRADSDPATWDFYNDYYSNPVYKSNVSVGNFSVSDRNVGGSGAKWHHLRNGSQVIR